MQFPVCLLDGRRGDEISGFDRIKTRWLIGDDLRSGGQREGRPVSVRGLDDKQLPRVLFDDALNANRIGTGGLLGSGGRSQAVTLLLSFQSS